MQSFFLFIVAKVNVVNVHSQDLNCIQTEEHIFFTYNEDYLKCLQVFFK